MTFSSEEWPKGKLQTVWIWNPGKFLSFCTGVLKMYNFGQIPSAILVDWAVFRTFLDFTKLRTRWSFGSIFLKIVAQKGRFDAIKENPNFLSCRGILHIYRQWLLKHADFASEWRQSRFDDLKISKFWGGECHRNPSSKTLDPRQELLVHRWVTLSIKFAGTHLSPLWRGTVSEVSCLTV